MRIGSTRIRIAIGLLWALVLGGCTAPPRPVRSMMQIREIQTREFESRNRAAVMEAVLNALQDDGFLAKNAVTELGLITAVKEAELERSTMSPILAAFLGRDDGRWPKSTVIEANATVSPFGRKMRVRVTFNRKVHDNWGAPLESAEVDDPRFYRDFFGHALAKAEIDEILSGAL